MIYSYIKIALRHLWRNRLFTGLNIVGLAIGISACWAIYQIVSYEFSFDTKHSNSDRIYRIVSRFVFDGKESGNAGAATPITEAVRKQVPGVELSVPLRETWIPTLKVPQAGGKPLSFEEVDKVYTTTSDYFRLINYTWLAGDVNQVLTRPNEVVLTYERARRYFPNLTPQQMVGRTMTYRDTTSVEVVGIVADLTYPTYFEGNEFISLSTEKTKPQPDEWGSTNSSDQTFVLLTPNTNWQRAEQQINALSAKNSAKILKQWGNSKRWHVLQPLSDVHFGLDYASGSRVANKNVLYGLMGLAFFILLLACINYINLSTAQVPQRAREIGIRKTLGSRQFQLISQFLGETFVITLLAVVVAYPFTILFERSFSDIIPDGASSHVKTQDLILFLVGLLVVVSLLSGVYPGWLISRFQPVRILRGQSTIPVGSRSRLTLRKALIVFQFVVAQVFIIGALITGQQLRFLFQKDLGFDRQAVLMVTPPWQLLEQPAYQNRHFTLAQEIRKMPGVTNVALGNPPFIGSYSSNKMKYKLPKGQVIERNVFRKYVDTEMLSLYNLKLLAGRNLQPSDTIREYIINETAVRGFGFKSPQEAIGKFVEQGKSLYPIVGVVRDFHTLSFHQKIDPVALMMSKEGLNTLNIKLSSTNPADWQKSINEMERLWKAFYPGEDFEYRFYDDTLASFYEEERKIERMINLATGIAILISGLGLFGLATLTAFQRTKEIGIRKVLGASIASIVALLSKDFVGLILIAIAIASPIAWYAMNRWLQNYAYHIDIAWWMFAVAGVLATSIALLTVSFQSIKAALMNPVKSLRAE